MKTIRKSHLALSVFLTLAAANIVVAAPIFGPSTLLTTNSDVLNVISGTTVLAYAVSGSTSTVNGVTFSGSTTQNGVTVTQSNFFNTANNGANSSALSTELFVVVGSNRFDDSNLGHSLTFTGLTIGQGYQLQIFGGTVAGISGTQILTHDGSVGTLSYNGNLPGSDVYFIIDTFTADSSTEVISFSKGVGPGYMIYNAINLQAVPEPNTFLLLAGAGTFVVVMRRRRRCH